MDKEGAYQRLHELRRRKSEAWRMTKTETDRKRLDEAWALYESTWRELVRFEAELREVGLGDMVDLPAWRELVRFEAELREVGLGDMVDLPAWLKGEDV